MYLQCLLSMKAVYKIYGTTRLLATLACAVGGLSASCREEQSYAVIFDL